MVSEELDELFEICDELVVMSEAEFLLKSKQKMSALEEIGLWMSAFGLKRRAVMNFPLASITASVRAAFFLRRLRLLRFSWRFDPDA